jgi:hypothetical protein
MYSVKYRPPRIRPMRWSPKGLWESGQERDFRASDLPHVCGGQRKSKKSKPLPFHLKRGEGSSPRGGVLVKVLQPTFKEVKRLVDASKNPPPSVSIIRLIPGLTVGVRK